MGARVMRWRCWNVRKTFLTGLLLLADMLCVHQLSDDLNSFLVSERRSSQVDTY